jgi:rare lipoprotein A (peptidoglycan hydrolase)
MTPTFTATRVLGACLAIASLLALSAAGAAARTSSSPSTGGTNAGPGNVGQPVPTPVGSTLGTLTFTPASIVVGETTTATGALATSAAGQPVALEMETNNGVWEAVATSTVAADGSFAITWTAKLVGTYQMRVVSGALASSTTSVGTPVSTLAILKTVIATWYGPGFYGHRTACGENFTRHILGVANRSLPCGTPVTLYYNGETLTVPVIDRGPYANGATFDLSAATAQALGITETVNVGYTFLRGQKIAPAYWYPAGATGPTGTTGASGTTSASGANGTTSSTGSDGSIAGGATAP